MSHFGCGDSGKMSKEMSVRYAGEHRYGNDDFLNHADRWTRLRGNRTIEAVSGGSLSVLYRNGGRVCVGSWLLIFQLFLFFIFKFFVGGNSLAVRSLVSRSNLFLSVEKWRNELRATSSERYHFFFSISLWNWISFFKFHRLPSRRWWTG